MNKKINVAVCGLGRAGWNMHCSELDSFSDLFQIVAGCDLLPDRRAELERRYPGIRTYEKFEDVCADPNVELVSVVTRSPDHVRHTRIALAAGKYVFLEKPIAQNLDEVAELEKLNAAYPGKLFIRHNRRFEAAFHHLRDIMDSGILGKIFEIKLARHRFQLRNDWQTLIGQGGGQLNNWGPHLIDHVLRLMDAPVKDCFADLKLAASRGDAEDHIKLVFRGENGRIIDLEISDCVTIPGPVYTVYGTRGTLICDDEKTFRMKYVKPGQQLPPHDAHKESLPRSIGYGAEFPVEWIEEEIPVKPADGAYMTDIYSRVYAAIRENVPYPVTMEQAAQVVRVTQMIKKQAQIQVWN